MDSNVCGFCGNDTLFCTFQAIPLHPPLKLKIAPPSKKLQKIKVLKAILDSGFEL